MIRFKIVSYPKLICFGGISAFKMVSYPKLICFQGTSAITVCLRLCETVVSLK